MISGHTGRIAFINISDGGVPKWQVLQADVTPLGIVGDAHRNLKLHGGTERAVVLFSLERINALAAEGHLIGPGSAGENVTIEGLDWNLIVPGAELAIASAPEFHSMIEARSVPSTGHLRLVVTKYTTPCATIQHCFIQHDQARISQKIHPGWSRVCARVIQSGTMRVGDIVTVRTPGN